MAKRKDTFAVAIDFGTTFSGIAYIQLSTRQLTQIEQWPGQSEASTYRVPTVVTYPYEGAPLWGFRAEQYDGRFRLKMRVFKPFLEPTYTSQCRTPPGIKLDDIVRVYIEGLYAHLVQYMAERDIYKDKVNLNFLLTVPATYADNTVENFRKIVKKTGIGSHPFSITLTEPEAASIYTIQTMKTQTTPVYRVNDCFVVCDAGGGTVDLSSYKILQLNPTITVEHTGIVSGSYCGSTIIDKEFTSYVKAQMGEDTWEKLGKAKTSPLIKKFIVEKERFNNSENEHSFNIFLGDIPCPGKKGPYLPISREGMRSFFGISLGGIQEMIEDHIAQCKKAGYQVKFIFLVGGLGCSPYTEKVVTEYAHTIDEDIQVIQPLNARDAIVLGAVSSHMQVLNQEPDPVQSRLCRKHYGIVKMKPFNDRRNFEYEKYIDPFSGVILAKEQIHWLIHKGERITGSQEKCFEELFKREFDQDHKTSWEEILVEFSGDNPPSRPEPGVRKICTMLPNLSTCSKSQFEMKKKKRHGIFPLRSTKYYHARYTIKIRIGTVGVIGTEMIYMGEPRPDLMKTLWNNPDEDQ